jgi:signal transduction histidine kinase
MNQRSTGLELARDPIAPPPSVLHRRRLLFARAAWVVLAAIVLGLDLAGIPYAYEQSASALTPEDARELGELGLSAKFYAAYSSVGLLTVVTLVFSAVAAVIFWRRSEDPIALFGSFTLLVFGGAAVSGTMHALADAHPAFRFPVNLLDYVGQVSFGVFFYLFPDGRFVPRWTRWLAAAAGLLFATNIFLPGSVLDLFRGPFFIAFIGSLLFAQVYRYRRVSSPAQRQQTKWVVFGSVVALVGFSVVFTLGSLPAVQDSGLPGEMLVSTLVYGFISLIPLNIGVAILRYRLWDIDLIINRTLVYGALTTAVVAIYVLAVGYLGALFQARGTLAISLVATGIVAVLFAPIRDGLQRGVNRLMYGERDDPYAVLSRLGERLEGTLAPEAVLPTVVRTVREALKLPYAAVALKEDEGSVVVAETGTLVGDPLRLPLIYQGETIGELVMAPRAPGEEFTPADRRLLEDLARQAGVASHAVRLTADLQRSRERLVSTREEERRRLRRDLHDGLGPTLGSLPLKLDIADDLVERDPATARALLRGLKSQTQSAVADIRRLVYALRPPALDDLGLVGAIAEAAAQYGAKGLSVSVEAPESESLPPLPAAVEVAAYRIAQEAMTNVARHARAQNCIIRLSLGEAAEELRLEISDDGRGIGEVHERGVGLHSMRERAEELGGTCDLETPPEGGTRVRASLPLAASEAQGS